MLRLVPCDVSVAPDAVVVARQGRLDVVEALVGIAVAVLTAQSIGRLVGVVVVAVDRVRLLGMIGSPIVGLDRRIDAFGDRLAAEAADDGADRRTDGGADRSGGERTNRGAGRQAAGRR